MPNINAAVAWAIEIANDDTHGYSQQNRYGPDYDCSSFVAAALIAGGFNVPYTMYTGNERSALLNAGFIEVPVTDARQKGDIFLIHETQGQDPPQHTFMCVDANNVVEAYNAALGILVQPYWDWTGHPWQYHFRWPGGSGGRVARWHNKNWGGYARNSVEAEDNAVMTYNALHGLGWTINAVAGLLGNVGSESGYNPWMWEGGFAGDTRVASTDTQALNDQNHGYGLLQFTPSANYCLSTQAAALTWFGPNYLDIVGNQNDGTAQLNFVHLTQAGAYQATSSYPETYDQYIASTQDADYLAAAWFYNYERGTGSIAQRQADAMYWQNKLPSLIDGYRNSRNMPIIFYLTRRTRR